MNADTAMGPDDNDGDGLQDPLTGQKYGQIKQYPLIG